MNQKYVKLDRGNVWHIYRGEMRHDLMFPEPVSICGTTLPEWETTITIKRPNQLGMCGRCLAKEES